MKDLVIIPTFNGTVPLKLCLNSLSDKYPILVVDTGSTNKKDEEFVRDIPKVYKELDIRVTRTPFKGYSTGALLWAYWNFPADNYLLAQDSIEAEEEDYLKEFKDRMQGDLGAVAWVSFNMFYDRPEQKAWMEYMYRLKDLNAPQGIFGPIFYISRRSLDVLNEKQLLPHYPIDKEQAQGMERAWAIALHNAGIRLDVIFPNWDIAYLMRTGELGVFRKTFENRQ